MNKNFLKFALSLSTIMAVSLIGCSDSSSSVADDVEEEEEKMELAETYDDLPECTEDNESVLYYVMESNAAYRCSNGKWIKLKKEYTPPTDTIVKTDTTIIKDTTVINDTTIVKDTTVVKDTTKVHLCGSAEYDPSKESCYNDEDVIVALCNSANKGNVQEGTSGQKYVCSIDSKNKLSWRELTEVEEVLNTNECTPENAGATTKFGYSNYICDAEEGWTFDYDNLEKGKLTVGDKEYETVGIGKQMWMAQNLNYTDSTAHPNLKGEVSCYGKNDDTNCEALGAYYSWTAAMDFPAEYADSVVGEKIKVPHQGICPEGWHIPALRDWNMLNDFVIGTNATDTTAGTGLKAATSWRDVVTSIDTTTNDTSKYSGNGNNAYGFNAYSTGTIKYSNGKYTSTEKGTFALFIVADEIACTYDYMDSGKCRDYLTPIRADLRFDKISLRYLQSDTYTRKTRMAVRCVADTYKD